MRILSTRTMVAALLAMGMWAAQAQEDAGTAGSSTPSTAPALPVRLDLATARSLALSHSPALKKMGGRVVEQQGAIDEQVSAFLPTVRVSGDYSVTDRGRLQSFGGSSSGGSSGLDDTRWSAGTEVALSVFSGGRGVAATRRERARLRAVSADESATTADVLLSVQEAYFDALLARETIAVLTNAVTVYEAQLATASNRLVAGVGAKIEVLQASVVLANAQPPLIRSRNDYSRHVDRLRRVIGLPLPAGRQPQDVLLAEVEEPAPQSWDVNEVVRRAVANRPELKALLERRDAEEFQHRYLRRESLPAVEVFGGYGIENDQFTGNELSGWVTGARLRWSLWEGGTTQARAGQSLARLYQIDEDREALELSIEGDVREAIHDYNEARAILANAQVVIEEAREAVRMASARYEANSGTQLDVLNAQLQRLRAELDRSTAAHDIRLAVARLERAIGEDRR